MAETTAWVRAAGVFKHLRDRSAFGFWFSQSCRLIPIRDGPRVPPAAPGCAVTGGTLAFAGRPAERKLKIQKLWEKSSWDITPQIPTVAPVAFLFPAPRFQLADSGKGHRVLGKIWTVGLCPKPGNESQVG